jgi:hypothetical protein
MMVGERRGERGEMEKACGNRLAGGAVGAMVMRGSGGVSAAEQTSPSPSPEAASHRALKRRRSGQMNVVHRWMMFRSYSSQRTSRVTERRNMSFLPEDMVVIFIHNFFIPYSPSTSWESVFRSRTVHGKEQGVSRSGLQYKPSK